jgi:hypothetical protein
MPDDIRQPVLSLLQQLPTRKLDALKQLFWSELNYDRANQPLSTRKWPEATRQALTELPILLATAGESGSFHIIYSRLDADRLLLAPQRQVVTDLLREHPYALFIFSDREQTDWHFVNVRYEKGGDVRARRIFRRITVGPYERLRTAAERISLLDIASLTPDLFGISPLVIQQRHDDAFDVEAVTKRFFATYRTIFEQAEEQITGIEGNARRLFTQRLFNRLLFLIFLERKGWLKFEGRYDYLQALWEAHQKERAKDGALNFYQDRLKLLFFSGLNTSNEVNIVGITPSGFLQSRIGQVPYLNGGLFEEDDLDRDPAIRVPDAALAPALRDLLYHYNFTVSESTPLDIEVAVDPEMLGKIFEELVTGRHETGSYYTPKPVVAFMGQEALKGYLETACPAESQKAIAAFVEERAAANLKNPERVLEALRAAKACDPACGSGAYLLGMLHELFDLRAALFAARQIDPLTAYQRKLEIIQNNLYGVDLDPFAVNIARLRLWLSLIVEFEGDDPPPLPNLDFKIEMGDSLTAPDPSGGLGTGFRKELVERFFRRKADYLMAHGEEKLTLREQIESLRSEISAWAGRPTGTMGFDWAVEFAEVFAGPEFATATLSGAMAGIVNAVPGQMELVARQRESGFDIVLANPPYVRQELLGGDYKASLKPIYPEAYAGTADLYVYFYARALQLLRPDGVLAFISPNKFMRAGYGQKLRQLLAQHTTIQAVIDFGDLPIFETTTYPTVLVVRKRAPASGRGVHALTVDDMDVVPYLTDTVRQRAWQQPQVSLRSDGWTLVQPNTLGLVEKLRHSGTSLGERMDGRFYRGVTTGLNDAFVIDGSMRDQLIIEDPLSAEIIKPWLRGRDVDRWRIKWAKLYVVFTRRGIDIARYPAVRRHLARFKTRLMPGASHGRKPGDYKWYEIQDITAYYEEFEIPKIIWAKYGIAPAFAYDTQNYYCGNTVFILPTDRLELVGILNSKVVQWFATHTFNIVRGGYIEWIPTNVAKLPIPDVPSAQRAAIKSLARRLLETGRRGPRVSEWEAELNRLVYDIYGLTDAEIALIENSMSKMELDTATKALDALRKEE